MIVMPGENRTSYDGADGEALYTGPMGPPRARRGITQEVRWDSLKAFLNRLEARIDRLEEQIELPSILQEALEFAINELREGLKGQELELRSEIYGDHAKIIAIATDVDLVQWSNKTFELEGKVMERFLKDTRFSIEIQVLRN